MLHKLCQLYRSAFPVTCNRSFMFILAYWEFIVFIEAGQSSSACIKIRYLAICFSILKLSFAPSGLSCVSDQWSDHPWLLFVHQWPVHLPGGGKGGVWAGHRSAVWDLLRLQPLHDLCGLPGHSGWSAGEMWVSEQVVRKISVVFVVIGESLQGIMHHSKIFK